MDQLGNQTNRFIGLCLPKQQFGYFALFVSNLGHSESKLHSICFFWIPDSVRKVIKSFEIFSQPDG